MIEMTSQTATYIPVVFSIGVLISTLYVNQLKDNEGEEKRREDQELIRSLGEQNAELSKRNEELINIKTDELKELQAELKTLSYQMYRSYLKQNTPELSLTSPTVNRDENALIFYLENTGKFAMPRIKFLYRNTIRYYAGGVLEHTSPESKNGRVYLRYEEGEEFAVGEKVEVVLPFMQELLSKLQRFDRVEIDTIITVSNPDFSTSNMSCTLIFEPQKGHWSTDSTNLWPTLRFGILP